MTPYDRHLSAKDPEQWEAGFWSGVLWAKAPFTTPYHVEFVAKVIRESTGRPWTETVRRLGLDPDPFNEGWALGVYGAHGLDQLQCQEQRRDQEE